MQIKEAKQQFVQAWGALGSQWGINKKPWLRFTH
jgi:DNA-binding transcriptional regulator GbsR (MarR family)